MLETRLFVSRTGIRRRRSIVKYGGQGQSSQAIELYQAPQKINSSHFLTHVSPLMMWNLHSYSTTYSFEWKNVAFLGGGVKVYSDPPTYF